MSNKAASFIAHFYSDIKIDTYNNIWITTHGGLVVYSPNTIIGINIEYSEIPKHFELFQNFPNPFNPTTNIKYQITKSEFVKLTIFDITGKEISKLVNENQNVGDYKVNFDADNLPSGIYFYQLKTESFIETKKMVLLK